MRQPFFSIIVPVYKVPQDYLECCLESIINQTFDEIEVILVDDGSPDNCGEICDEYAKKDSRIKVIHQENQGVSEARNNGIKAAKADWIMFVDSDDWIELDACERLKKHLDSNLCDILMFNGIKEYTDRQEKMNYGFENGRMYITENVDIREFIYRRAMQAPNAEGVRYCPAYYSWDKVYNRAFLINNALQYPKGLSKSEDKVFILRCFEKLNSLYYVDEILYHYRIHPSSVCNRYSENVDKDRIHLARLLSEIAERFDEELGRLKGVEDYNLITKDYMRFIFGIISDVLFLKYYHPDNPHKKTRSIEAKKFINTEPFKSSIRECRYSELTIGGKVKKFLLSLNLVSTFCFIHKIGRMAHKKIVEE